MPIILSNNADGLLTPATSSDKFEHRSSAGAAMIRVVCCRLNFFSSLPRPHVLSVLTFQADPNQDLAGLRALQTQRRDHFRDLGGVAMSRQSSVDSEDAQQRSKGAYIWDQHVVASSESPSMLASIYATWPTNSSASPAVEVCILSYC